MAGIPSGLGGNGYEILFAGGIMIFFTLVLYGLRAYAASKINGKWRWDFIWVTIGLIFGLVSFAPAVLSAYYGLGNDMSNLSFPQVFETVKWLWIAIYLGLCCVTFAKFSVAALLLQIQGPSAKKQRIALWAMCFSFGIVNFIQLFLAIFQCDPVEKLWYRAMPGTCNYIDLTTKWNYFQGAVSVVTDAALALWPISIAWNLQASMKVKVGFCGLMALGMLPAIASLLRVIWLPGALKNPNVTHAFNHFLLFAMVELWTIFILSSIPVLRPLFLRVFYGIREKTQRSTHHKSSDVISPGVSGIKSFVPLTLNQMKSSRMSTPYIINNDSREKLHDVEENVIVSRAYGGHGQP